MNEESPQHPTPDEPTEVLGASTGTPDEPTEVRGGATAAPLPDDPTSVHPSDEPTSVHPSDAPTSVGSSNAPTSVRPSDAPTSAGSSYEPTSVGSSDAPTSVGSSYEPTSVGSSGEPTGVRAGVAGEPSAFSTGSGAGFPPPPPPAAGFTPGGAEPPPGGFPPGGSPAGAWRVGPDGTIRRLTRSTQRKVIGGVAGGLGEYTGIDPVLFRVLFAVLTLFGGSGILLYVAAWLLLPADDQATSPVESLIGRGTRGGPSRSRDTLVAAALIAAGLVLAGVVAIGDARDLALCLLVVGGAYFLIRNLNERRQGGPPQPVAPEPPPVPYQAFDTPAPPYQPGGTATITAPAPVAPPKAPRRRREHSILGVLSLCVLLVAVGVTAAFDNGSSSGPDVQTYLAIATGIIGLGLLVGTFVGRARWLAWLGLPILALLIVVSTSGLDLDGGTGDQVFTPTSALDVQPTYRLGVGSLRIDLGQVDLSEQVVNSKASLGVGDIEIVVPRNADVMIDAHAGIGDVLLFGEDANGTSVNRSVVNSGIGGDGKIDLVLDLDVNIGQVKVDRAQA